MVAVRVSKEQRGTLVRVLKEGPLSTDAAPARLGGAFPRAPEVIRTSHG
jgi:hypothetical protein